MKPLPAFVTRCHFFITWKVWHSAAAVDGKQYGGLISIQIAARNIRISLDKRIAFWKETYDVSEETRGKANMIPVKRTYLLYLQTVLIIAGPGVTIYNASKQHVHGKRHILSLKSKFLET